MLSRLKIFSIIFTASLARLALAGTYYVDANSSSPTPPYTNWSTAATNIQAALDVSAPGDLILVTNGVYRGGITATNAVTLRSANGAAVTFIDGAHATGCASLANGAALIGFTVTNGYAFTPGGVLCASTNVLISNCIIISNICYGSYCGGVYSGTLSNCSLISNDGRANGSGNGGGARASVLYNCLISGNVSGSGGGAYSCTLNNCVLRGNQALQGGGATGAILSNCLVVSNTAYYDSTIGNQPTGGGLFGGSAVNCTIAGNAVALYPNFTLPAGGGVYGGAMNNCIISANKFGAGATDNYAPGSFNNCCTTPLPSSGINNFTNAPLFVNQSGGNFRLQSNSPCINSGKNTYVQSSSDLDGNSRVSGGTVDIGAYEFQAPSSVLSYAWAQQFGVPTSGSADFADPDADGMNNWQEWIAGTVPTNSASLLKMLSLSTNAPGLRVSWQSVSNRTYFLQRATSLVAQPTFSVLQTNLSGQAGTTAYNDTAATNAGPYFYRVGVQ